MQLSPIGTQWDTVVWVVMNLPDELFKQKLVPVDAQATQNPKVRSHCNVPQLA